MRKRSYSFTEGKEIKESFFVLHFDQRCNLFFSGHSRTVSVLPNKRWKNSNKHKGGKNKTVLPSKFLLGGNIRDPLNLNSLSDERISKIVNAITPESSPLPTPKHRKAEYKIEVLIPPNISDPLNLNCGVDENEYESQLISPGIETAGNSAGGNASAGTKKKKFRYRKRIRGATKQQHSVSMDDSAISAELKDKKDESGLVSGAESEPETVRREVTSGEKETEPKDDVKKSEETEEKVEKEPQEEGAKSPPHQTGHKRPSNVPVSTPANAKKQTKEGDIVSPVGAQQKPHPKKNQHFHIKGTKNSHQSAKNSRKQYRNHFQNFNHRKRGRKGNKSQEQNQGSKTPKFNEKNKKFEYGNYDQYYGYRNPDHEPDIRLRYIKPDWLIGKDILDIGCNVGHITMAVGKHFKPKSIVGMDIDKKLVDRAKRNLARYASITRGDGEEDYPICFPLMYGPIKSVALMEKEAESEEKGVVKEFPANIKFVCANYVLDSDDLLETTHPEFDVIMCLSTTKWIHLNFGDDGLKRAFKRMYAHLRPGNSYFAIFFDYF